MFLLAGIIATVSLLIGRVFVGPVFVGPVFSSVQNAPVAIGMPVPLARALAVFMGIVSTR